MQCNLRTALLRTEPECSKQSKEDIQQQKTGKLTPLQLVEKMSTNPCRILSVPGGTLSVGAPADITIADMDSEYVIDKNTFLSKGKNTPFDGAKVNGRVYYTIVGGNIVYQYA